MIKPGDVIEDRYRILNELGCGGMGAVFLAEDVALNRKVAVKALPDLVCKDEDAVKNFFNEAKKAAALKHPNIVTIYNVGTLPDGQPYFALEYLGKNLSSRIRAGNMNPGEKIKAVAGVLKGLSYAHEKGFIHRDIKPENIMFNDVGEAVIIDFGIARGGTAVKTLTSAGLTKGTPHYMSPEQCKGQKLDQRSDLYSLGVVLYEALAGQVPFDAEEVTAIMYLQVHEPPDLEKLNTAGVDRGLVDIVKKALSKRPEDRFQTALEFGMALSRADIKGPETAAGEKKTVEAARITYEKPSKRLIFIIFLILIFNSFALYHYFSRKDTAPLYGGGIAEPLSVESVSMASKHRDNGPEGSSGLGSGNTVSQKNTGSNPFARAISENEEDECEPNSIKNPRLRAAAEKKDNAEILNILKKDETISLRDKSICLIDAIIDKNLDMAENILDAGANANCCEEVEAFSALLLAAQRGDREMMKLLIERGAEINVPDRFGTPLTCAFELKDIDFIKYLIDKGADVNLLHGPDDCTTPIMSAISGAGTDMAFTVELAKLLLARGADPNKIVSKNNFSPPLIAAVETKSFELVKLLVDNNADIEAQDYKRQTALDVARQRGSAEIFDFLSKKLDRNAAVAVPVAAPADIVDFNISLPAWIVCCEASASRDEITRAVGEWRKRGFESNFLWIPDFESLSGAKMWLAYVGPVGYEDKKSAADLRNKVKKYYSEAYVLRLDHRKGREVLK
jgi:serine/threonine protein kinase